MGLMTHPSQELLGLTSAVGSPILVFMKFMRSSGKFCDWLMTWCSSGLFGTGSAKLSASHLKRMHRIQACLRSIAANCDMYALWLVLVNRALLVRCSRSPCEVGNECYTCYDQFSLPVGRQNRGGSGVREILTAVHQEFSGCAHCCVGKPKRRDQDRASPRRRGRTWSGTAEG